MNDFNILYLEILNFVFDPFHLMMPAKAIFEQFVIVKSWVAILPPPTSHASWAIFPRSTYPHSWGGGVEAGTPGVVSCYIRRLGHEHECVPTSGGGGTTYHFLVYLELKKSFDILKLFKKLELLNIAKFLTAFEISLSPSSLGPRSLLL